MAAKAMDQIADDFASRGVASVFLYTREAHPGEHYPHLTSFEQKLEHAKALRDVLGVRRPILVDSLDGALHHRYTLLPNMCFIIGRSGHILYKADWTSPPDIRTALEEIIEGRSRQKSLGEAPFYTERIAFRDRDRDGFIEGLRRAGPKALSDFGVKE